MIKLNQKTGFTLIELLVVIAIIGLLSSVVLASLNSARTKSRDAKRQSDLNQLSLALEFYFDTHNGYPSDTFGGWEQPCITTTNDIGKLVTESFISSIPCDPINSGSGGGGLGYYFDTNTCTGGFCQAYCLYAVQEAGGVYSRSVNYPTCP